MPCSCLQAAHDPCSRDLLMACSHIVIAGGFIINSSELRGVNFSMEALDPPLLQPRSSVRRAAVCHCPKDTGWLKCLTMSIVADVGDHRLWQQVFCLCPFVSRASSVYALRLAQMVAAPYMHLATPYTCTALQVAIHDIPYIQMCALANIFPSLWKVLISLVHGMYTLERDMVPFM